MTPQRRRRFSKLIALLMLTSVLSAIQTVNAYNVSLIVPTIGDTTTTEKLRKMLPKGYYVFTELAAKDALENKIKVGAYWEKLGIAESALERATGDLLVRTIERNVYKNKSEQDLKSLKKANRKLAFANILNYVEAAAIVVLIIVKSPP